jgi:hypothetical protein
MQDEVGYPNHENNKTKVDVLPGNTLEDKVTNKNYTYDK